MKKKFTLVPVLALLLAGAPTTATVAEPLSVNVQELYQRYPHHIEQVNEALEAGEEYLTYSSRAWDAIVEADAAQEAADLAAEAAAQAVEDEEAAIIAAEEAEAYAQEKEEESREASQQALNAYNAQRRGQVGGGNLPPVVSAMVMSPESLEDYQRGIRNMRRVQDVTSYSATVAEKARIEADEAKAEALSARDFAQRAAEHAQSVQEAADEAFAEAQKKIEESEALLNAAESRQSTASVALTSIDAQEGREPDLAGVELARKESVTTWWEENKDEEVNKPRGQEAVSKKVEEVEKVVRDRETEPATPPPANVGGGKSPLTEKLEQVRHEAEEQTREVAPAREKGMQRADQAVATIGTPSQDMKCTTFIARFYGEEEAQSLADLSVSAKRIKISEAIPGDIIYYETPDGGIGQAGVYIGGGTTVVSSDPAGVVTTESALSGSFASRPGVPADEEYERPQDSGKWECGGIPQRQVNADALWVLPFSEYEMGAKFERGVHESLEFIRKGEDDVIYAPYGGLVSVVDGGTVNIESEGVSISLSGINPDNIVTRTGARIEKGDPVATGDRVLVKATVSGESVNPEALFFASWGGGRMADASGENQFGKAKFANVPPSISPAVLPVDLGGAVRQTSGWGPRKPPVAGADPFHRGIDFGGPTGTPVKSVLDGVVWATFNDQYSGNQVIIQYRVGGRDYAVIYKHLSSAHNKYVQEGDMVRAGEVIGEIGSTGRFSTGPHLHFEVWDTVFNRDHHINASEWLTMIGAW